MHLLSIILLPLIGAAWLAARPGMNRMSAGRFALIFSVLATALAGTVDLLGDARSAGFALPWIPDAGIELRFSIDGVSLLFLVLTGLVTSFAIAASFQLAAAGRSYFILILILQSSLFGVFTARHFVPWFLCWEMTLVPSYLLIRLWGGPAAPLAAMRFFLMTLGGSAFMLVGFLALQLSVGTMDFTRLSALAAAGKLAPSIASAFGGSGLHGHTLLTVVALAVFLGLAVKIPVVPFHSWLPGAYCEAPTPVTMLLTGLLSKMGVFALLMVFLPIFVEVLPSLAPLFSWLAVATILLGALAALSQTDMKRMLAYSSVNHLGYCVLAITAASAAAGDRGALSAGISGTILQAFNHGVIAASLFYGIAVLEQRAGGRRGLHDFGGLRTRMPVFCGLFGIATFASLGLPGLSGFVGEFLMFSGAFKILPAATSVSALGLLLTAVFLLRMLRKVFHGPLNPQFSRIGDLNISERILLGISVFLIALFGLAPGLLLDVANPAIQSLVNLITPTP